ncbi:MAG: squalene/phytoene synthase family protein [Bdellovibrionota bacterium]
MPTQVDALAEFNQPHLDRVSRSFAHGIRQLSPSLRAPVGLSYLICRLLDTVEDASWGEGEFRDQAQAQAFAAFDSFVEREPKETEVRDWASRFPLDLTEGERILLEDAPRVFRELHALPPEDRKVIAGPVLSMSRGMNHFMSRKRKSGVLRLSNLGETQSYCFFVAGVVGEVLTGLLKLRSQEAAKRNISLTQAGRFGLFLQKVNILKDQRVDEAQNRFLVPSRQGVLRSAMRDAREAMAYLESIPISETRYRVFCAWALLLGLASIPAIEKGYSRDSVGKLPRVEAMWLAHKIEARIGDEAGLRRLFDDLIAKASAGTSQSPNQVTEAVPTGPLDPELLALYDGQMGPQELMGLLASV